MKFATLFSGSKGNCSLVTTNSCNILIDCGTNLTRISKALEQFNLRLNDIDAVLITHEHSDHTKALRFFNKLDTKIFIHKLAAQSIVKQNLINPDNVISFDKPFFIDDVSVDFVKCNHDVPYCCGYKLTEGQTSLATITDTGIVTEQMLPFINNCKLLLLESNYDTTMLQCGCYPYSLKQRVGGARGHLSNDQAAQTLVKLPNLNVKDVILGHLSETNNTPEIAMSCALLHLEKARITIGKDINVHIAKQFVTSEVIDVK